MAQAPPTTTEEPAVNATVYTTETAAELEVPAEVLNPPHVDTCDLTMTHEDDEGYVSAPVRCGDVATTVHITTFDLLLEATDAPRYEVIVRRYCATHSAWMQESDQDDCILVSARYNAI